MAPIGLQSDAFGGPYSGHHGVRYWVGGRLGTRVLAESLLQAHSPSAPTRVSE